MFMAIDFDFFTIMFLASINYDGLPTPYSLASEEEQEDESRIEEFKEEETA